MTWDKYAVGFVFGLALGAYFGESPRREVKQDAVPAMVNRDQGKYDRLHGVIDEVSPQGIIKTNTSVDYKGIEKHLRPGSS